MKPPIEMHCKQLQTGPALASDIDVMDGPLLEVFKRATALFNVTLCVAVPYIEFSKKATWKVKPALVG